MKQLYFLVLCMLLQITAAAQSPDPGEARWRWAFNIPDGGVALEINAITLDNDQNVYVTGSFSGSIDLGNGARGSTGAQDAFIAKYDSAGNIIWDLTFGDTDGFLGLNGGHDIIFNGDNHLFVAGYFCNSPNIGGFSVSADGTQDAFLIKIDLDGNVEWVRTWGGGDPSPSNYNDLATSLDVIDQSRIIVGGFFTGNVTLDAFGVSSSGVTDQDGFIAVFDQNAGVAEGLISISEGTDAQSVLDVAYDANFDYILATGSFAGSGVDFGDGSTMSSSGGSVDAFLAAYSSDLSAINWLTSIGDAGNDIGQSLDVNNNGTLIVGGIYRGTNVNFEGNGFQGVSLSSNSSSTDGFVAAFSVSNGTGFWAQSIGGANNGDYVSKVVAREDGSFYAGGYFQGTFNLGNNRVLSNIGNQDIFVIKFDDVGNNIDFRLVQAITEGGSGGQAGVFGMTPYARGIYLTGYFSNSLNLSGISLTASSGRDILIGQLQDPTPFRLSTSSFQSGVNAGVAAMDYDGDNDLDLFEIDNSNGGISEVIGYRNDGEGNFSADFGNSISIQGFESFLVPADFNADVSGNDLVDFFFTGNPVFIVEGNSLNAINDIGPGDYIDRIDYNNDGRWDVLAFDYLTGNGVQMIQNDGSNNFTIIPGHAIDLPGVFDEGAILAVGDVNDDSYSDILVSGFDGALEAAMYIYDPSTGAYLKQNWGVVPQVFGDAEFFDFDNDGDLDLITVGSDGSTQPLLYYENTGSTFDIIWDDAGLENGDLDIADLDQDGDADFIVTGDDGSDIFTRFYRNDGSGSFTNLGSLGLPGFTDNQVNFNDFDNDGDPDLFVGGLDENANPLTALYFNDYTVQRNFAPSAPTGLAFSPSANGIILSWSTSGDSETPVSGLTYNVGIGTSPGNYEIMPLQASNTFKYDGETGQFKTQFAEIQGLTTGITYYWVVQAQDPSGNISSKSIESTFEVPNVIYVDQNATGADNGSSWGDAFNDLSVAINAASTLAASGAEVEVWVAAGEYGVVNRGIDIAPGGRASLYGGFDGTEEARNERSPGTNQTIMNAGSGGYHLIIDGGGDFVLDGFTMTEGQSGSGGSLFLRNNIAASISDCYFFNNVSTGGGGAIFTRTTGRVIVQRSTFENNYADADGGGAILINNASGQLVVANCTFYGNSEGNLGGGAINLENYLAAEVYNSTFFGNQANGFGGAIRDILNNVQVFSSAFSNNSAGVFDIDIYENDIYSQSTLVDQITTTAGMLYPYGGSFIYGNSGVIDALANYGGNVPTLPISFSSNERDNGSPFSISGIVDGDARGVDPIQNVDIGAYEFNDRKLEVDTDNITGKGSLTDAVNYSNNHVGPDTICFNPGLAGATIILNSTLNIGNIDIGADSTFITGDVNNDSLPDITISGDGRAYGFDIYEDAAYSTFQFLNFSAIQFFRTQASPSYFYGNYFGTSLDGLSADNTTKNLSSIDLSPNSIGSDSIYFGGPQPKMGNLVSGSFSSGVRVNGDFGVRIENNIFGADVTGLNPLNTLDNNPVDLNTPAYVVNNVIGSPSTTATGLEVRDNGSGSVIRNNFIGIGRDTASSLSIQGTGLRLSSNNRVENNVIANIDFEGVLISSGSLNRLRGNIFFNNNTSLFINSGAQGGVTPPRNLVLTADSTLTGEAAPNAFIQIYADSTNTNASRFLTSFTAAPDGTFSYKPNYASFDPGFDHLLVLQDSASNTSGFASTRLVFNSLHIVTNTNDAGPGSLREAILNANGRTGADTILFDAALDGDTIVLNSELDALTDDNTILTTEGKNIWLQAGTGFSDNLIVLSGDNIQYDGLNLDGNNIADAGMRIDGSFIQAINFHSIDNIGQGVFLNSTATRDTIRNATIYGNGFYGVLLQGRYNALLGSKIGTDATGEFARGGHPQFGAVVVLDSSTIGGYGADRNIIAGNDSSGIYLAGVNNIVINNYIGLNINGEPLGNGGNGILMDDENTTTNELNLIGDGTAAGRNVIAANVLDGIRMLGSLSNTINDNLIGVNESLQPRPNGGSGISLQASSVPTASRFNAIQNNVIAYNTDGILMQDAGVQENEITNNIIYGNTNEGILLFAGTQNDIAPPVISSLDISGFIEGTAQPNNTVVLYADSTNQGQQFLASIVADGSGNWSTTLDLDTVITGLDSITATQNDGTNYSAFSNAVGIPRPEIDLFVYSGNNRINLYWAPVDGITDYEVIYGTDSTSGLTSIPVADTTFSISGLTNDVLYFTAVVAGSDTSSFQGAVPTFEAGRSAVFDGTNEIIVPDTSLNLTPEFTIEAWIKPEKDFQINTILTKIKPGGDQPGFGWYVNTFNTGDHKLIFETENFNYVASTDSLIEDGVWQHIAIIFDGTLVKMYKNGAEVDYFSFDLNPQDSPDSLIIGEFTNNPGFGFEGEMDEIRYWSRALSVSELNFKKDKPVDSEQDRLRAIWQFDEPPGTTTAYAQKFDFNGYWDNDSSAISGAMRPLVDTLFATGLQDTVRIDWSFFSTDVDSIRIFRNTSSVIDTAVHELITLDYDPASPFYFDTAVVFGDTLWYQIAGIDSVGQIGDLSLADSAVVEILPAPDAVFTTTSDQQVTLHWNAVADASGYTVLYGTDTTNLGSLTSEAASDTTFTVSGLTNNTLYYFAVASVNGDTTSFRAAVPVLEAGRALSLSIPSYARVVNNPAWQFEFNEDFTVEFWFLANPVQNSTETEVDLISAWNGSGVYSYVLRMEKATGQLYGARFDGPNFPNVINPTVVNDSLWHHVAFVRRSGTLYLYVDGISGPPIVDNTANPLTNSADLFISSRAGGLHFFEGQIDEVRIWNYGRTASEILSAIDTPIRSFDDRLVLYLPFNTSDTLIDYSKTRNIGFYQNGASTVNSRAMHPAAVTNLIAEPGDSEISLSWSPNSEQDFNNYQIVASLNVDLSSPVSNTTNLGATDTTEIISGLTNNQLYFIGVWGLDSAGQIGDTVIITSVPVVEAGRALSFDGVSYLKGSSVDTVLGGSEWTFMFWAKRNNTNTLDFVLGQGIPSFIQGLHLGFRGTDNKQLGLDFFNNQLFSDVLENTTTWHHYAVSYGNGNVGTIYQDGIELVTSGLADYNYTDTIYIGRLPWVDGVDNFEGQLDEIALFQRVLTQEEIQGYMDKPIPVNASDLAYLWHADEPVGTGITYDAGIRKYDLEWFNSPVAELSGAMAPVVDTLIASTVADSVILSWNFFSNDVEFVNIYRHNDVAIDTSVHLLITIGATDTFYVDNSIVAGDTLWYQIAGIDSVGQIGDLSLADSAVVEILPAPDAVFTTTSDQQVTLHWNAVADASGYTVLYGTDTTNLGSLTSEAASDTTFTVSGLTNNTLYYFAVASVNGDTTSFKGAVPVVEAGRSLSLDGINDYGAILNDGSWSFGTTDEFTVEVWVRVGNITNLVINQNDIISTWSDGLSPYPFVIRYNNENHPNPGTVDVSQFDGTTPSPLTSTDTINDGRWHHIAYTRQSDNNFYLYIDGVLQGSTPDVATGPLVSNDTLFIGKRQNELSVATFAGEVDELRIWNFAKTDAEIQSGLNGKAVPDDAGIIGLWHFDEPSGNTISYDATSNSNHALLFNGTGRQTSGAMAPLVEIFTATTVNDSVSLSWRFLNTDVSSVNIYRHTTNALDTSVHLLTNIVAADTFYIDGDINPGDTLWYQIAGIDSAGNIGDLSSVDSVVIPEPYLQYSTIIEPQNAVFSGNVDVTAVETTPTGVTFDETGTRMYIVGFGNRNIAQYSLSIPFDVTSVTLEHTLGVSGLETFPSDIFITPDGRQLFIIGDQGDDVTEFLLSTPYDISSATASGTTFSVASQDTSPLGVTFDQSGLRMFMIGNINDAVFSYSLSAPYAISTAVYTGQSYSVFSLESQVQGIAFNGNGSRMFVTGSSQDSVRIYSLSDPYNITTSGIIGSQSVAAQTSGPFGINFSVDGTKMFIAGSGNIFQYDLGNAAFSESAADDGSVNGSLIINAFGTSFANAGTTLTEGSQYSVNNLPSGLTPLITVSTDGTSAVLTFSGNATLHANPQDVDSIEINFNDAAFTAFTTSEIENAVNANTGLKIDFNSALAPSEIVTLPSDQSVELKWNAITNVSDYVVLYGLDSTNIGGLSTLAVVGDTTTTLSGLTNEALYFFAVASANGDTSTFKGAVPVIEAGKAIQFDGIDDFNTTNDSITNLGQQDFSISVWINTALTDRPILSKSDGDNIWEPGEVVYYLIGGRPNFEKFDCGRATGEIVINDNKWHHVVFAYDHDTQISQFYVDGTAVTTTSNYTGCSDSSGTILDIARGDFADGGRVWDGAIDELSIWQKTLSAPEVINLLSKPAEADDNNLLAVYHFDEPEATLISYDATGNNFHSIWNDTVTVIDSRAMFPFAPDTLISLSDSLELNIEWSQILITDLNEYRIVYDSTQALDTPIGALSTTTIGDTTITITGLSNGKLYTIGVLAIDSAGQVSDTIRVLGVPTPKPYDNVWIGQVDDDWFNAGNWLNNSIPVATDTVWIPNIGIQPLITSVAVAKMVDIDTDAGALLVIDADSGGELQLSPD